MLRFSTFGASSSKPSSLRCFAVGGSPGANVVIVLNSALAPSYDAKEAPDLRGYARCCGRS